MQVTLAGSAYPYKPSDDELSRTSIEFAAFDGEVGNGILPILDRLSNYNVFTGRQALIEEGAVLLSDGFMLDQDRVRGFSPAVAREYQFGLADANALLDGFRLNQRRPSETDYERVIFFAGAIGPSWDTTWVLNSNTVTMPGKRYYGDGGWTAELIPDLVSYTGKTLFLHDKADGSGRCLHYHILTTGHTCGLEISDVIDESLGSATTFFPQQPQRTRTSIDLRNNVKGVDQAGRVSVASDSTSITDHDADGLYHQVQLDLEASSQSDLDQQTAAFLASQKDDLDTYTCSIGPLDEDALALIRVGDIITVTSTVMGLSASPKRISHMTLTPLIGEGSRSKVRWWMAALEMGAPIRRRARVSTARPPLPDTEPFVCIPPDYTVLSDTDSPQLFTVFPDHINGQSSRSTDFTTLYEGATYRIDYECYHAPGPDPVGSNGLSAFLAEQFGGQIGTSPAPVVGPGSGTAYFMGDIRGPFGCSFGPPTDIALASTTWTVTGYMTTVPVVVTLIEGSCTSGDSYGSSLSAVITYISGPDPRFEDLPLCGSGDLVPFPGQEVHDAPFVGDGTTDSGSTMFAHQAGTIILLVNGIDWSDQVTDVNDFDYTVAYPFPLLATVEVHYRAD